MSISHHTEFPYRQNLDEVSLARPVLILLVVLYHSMAIHTGNWTLPEGLTVIPAYKVIGRLSYAFMLESFVFVSGYVWAYQRETKGRKDAFLQLCRKKAVRLLIPTIVFGLLYCCLFERNQLTILHLLEGPGHLWFLPMLFECFIISWLLLRTNISLRVVLPVLFLLGIIMPPELPFRLSYTFYYLPFFLLGYYLYGWYDRLKDVKLIYIIVAWGLFIVSYFGMVIFRSWLAASVFHPVLLGFGKTGSMIVYSLFGTIALILTSIYLTRRIKLTDKYVKLGSLCMGVYIFQQFVLELFYYHTRASFVFPNWLLPLLGFVLALVLSLIFTYVIRTTKLGKHLI